MFSQYCRTSSRGHFCQVFGFCVRGLLFFFSEIKALKLKRKSSACATVGTWSHMSVVIFLLCEYRVMVILTDLCWELRRKNLETCGGEPLWIVFKITWRTFRIFIIFLLLGAREEESKAKKGGLLKNGEGLSGPISRDNAILSLRYPISRDTFLREVSTPPKRCDTPPFGT